MQDNSVLHAPPGIPVDIRARRSTVAHGCVVHGANVGARTDDRQPRPVLDGVVIGARCLIAAHSLVTGGAKIPDDVLVMGVARQIPRPGGRHRRENMGEDQCGDLPDLAQRTGPD